MTTKCTYPDCSCHFGYQEEGAGCPKGYIDDKEFVKTALKRMKWDARKVYERS